MRVSMIQTRQRIFPGFPPGSELARQLDRIFSRRLEWPTINSKTVGIPGSELGFPHPRFRQGHTRSQETRITSEPHSDLQPT